MTAGQLKLLLASSLALAIFLFKPRDCSKHSSVYSAFLGLSISKSFLPGGKYGANGAPKTVKPILIPKNNKTSRKARTKGAAGPVSRKKTAKTEQIK